MGHRNLRDRRRQLLHRNLHVYLTGKKLEGDWQLTKDAGQDNKWSLIKIESAMKPVTARKDDSSTLTGRTMAEIAAARDAQWQSNGTGD